MDRNCRNTRYPVAGMDIPSHDGACADHGIVPYRDALQDDRTRTNPHIAANPHRARDKGLVGHRSAAVGSVIMIGDVAERTDKASASNLNLFGYIHHGEAIDVGPAADDQPGRSDSR